MYIKPQICGRLLGRDDLANTLYEDLCSGSGDAAEPCLCEVSYDLLYRTFVNSREVVDLWRRERV
jgi:hypothetical protein